MGVKGILGGGMLSDSKSVKKVTDPVKQYGMGTAPAVAKASNFEQEIKRKRKTSGSSLGVGANLLN